MSIGVAGETSDSVIAIMCKLGGDEGQKGAKHKGRQATGRVSSGR